MAFLSSSALSACDAGRPVVRVPTVISYEAHGCYGSCPIYRVTVARDGSGRFVGREHVAVRGERAFRISPAQFMAFAAHVAPLRPKQGAIPRDPAECNRGDGPTYVVTWESEDGDRQSFCLGDHGEVPPSGYSLITTAPALLPVRDWIGRES